MNRHQFHPAAMRFRDQLTFLCNVLLALIVILLVTGTVVRTAIYFNVLPMLAGPLDGAD
jgi:hypothetical protein